MRDISARELKGHNILAVERFHSFPFVVMMGLRVAAALVRFEVEDMALGPEIRKEGSQWRSFRLKEPATIR